MEQIKFRRKRSLNSGASYANIWNAGKAISGGFGLWGHWVMQSPNATIALHVWVDALREKGYPDRDIVLYGDWTDGRHLADGLDHMKSYDEMKQHILKWSRPLCDVQKTNITAYPHANEKLTPFIFILKADRKKTLKTIISRKNKNQRESDFA